jgi:hypothetical protein
VLQLVLLASHDWQQQQQDRTSRGVVALRPYWAQIEWLLCCQSCTA